MDPLSLLGGIASAGAIIGGITKTAHMLCTLRGKYTEADLTLGSIITELAVVKAALHQIQDWIDYNKDGLIQEELGEALAVSLSGCKECIDLLSEDVKDMVGGIGQRGAEVLMRTRTLWNEAMMKEHQNRLHHQISALQLLLHAVQVRSLAGQAAIIRQPKARRVIQQVKDDKSTIRATSRLSRADSSQRDSVTTRTCAESTISGPCLPWLDSQILSSDVYQKHGAAAIAKHDEHQPRASEMDEISDNVPKSPTSTTSSERRQRPQPRLITANLLPPAPRPVMQTPQSPALLTPESMPRTPMQYSPMTPITPGGSASRSPLNQSIQRWPVVAVGGSGPLQQQNKSAAEKRPGLKAKLRSSFGRTSFSPKTPTSASPTSPDSTVLRIPRRAKPHRQDRNTEVYDGHTDAAPIIKFTRAGSIWDVEHLLHQGSTVDTYHMPTGRTALAVAAHCGHVDICGLLINHQAAIEAADCNDKTPLHLAVEYERLDVVELLLQYGAKTQCRDRAQNTPLHEAAFVNDADVTRLLLDYGADPMANNLEHQTALHIAACAGSLEVAEMLTSKLRQIDIKGRNGMTPLMQAAATGKTMMVGLLLKKKASVKSKCAVGWSTLHYAAANGHADIVDLLLSKRMAVDVRADDGRTPLMLSASTSFSTTDLLLRKGAHLHATCSNSKQPIHYASEADNLPVLRLLLESGAGVDSAGPLKTTPVHIATSIGSTEQVQTLIHYGADVDVRNAAGDRPLCIAAAGGQVAMVETLLENGATPTHAFSLTNSSRDSPLCIACKHGHLDVAAYLLTKGASVNERDAQGWHPLRHGIYNAWPEVVEMLLANGAVPDNADYAYDAYTCFATFAPGISNNDPRKLQIRAMLQSAKARERPHVGDVVVSELEESRPRSANPTERLNLHTVQSIGVLEGSQTWSSAQPEVGVSTPMALRSTAHLTSPTEPRATATSGISPITDSTYHIQWPWPGQDYSSTDCRSSLTQRSQMTSLTSAVSPLTSGTIASATRGSSSASPMTLQAREQLRRLRCVACSGMGRDLPDFACIRCRQNVFGVRGAQRGAQPLPRFDAEHGPDRFNCIYEMDATHHGLL